MPQPSEFAPVPVATEPLYRTLLNAIWSHCAKQPNKIAFMSAEDNSISITYKELYFYAQSISSFLHKRHFGHGNIACVILPNCWQYAAFFIGATMTGGAISGASFQFTDYELLQQFKDSKCKVALCCEESLGRVLKAAKDCPSISTVIVVPKREYQPEDCHRFPWGVIEWSVVVSEQPDMHRPSIDHDIVRDIVVLPYSSGTTGSPKGVMLTHKNFGTMITALRNHIDNILFPKLDPDWDWSREHMLILLPFYHIYGCGLLMLAMIEGTTALILRRFDGDVFCKTIQNFKVRVLMLVPPVLVFLAKSPVTLKYDLSSVLFILSGAAPAGKDLCDEVMNKHKNIKYLLQGYGMTEMGMASHLPVIDPSQKFGNAGKLLSNYEQKIVNLKTGEECKPGESGELWVKGPTVMIGYLNKPQSTAEAIDDNGWLRTGDIGYIDEKGYLFIVDRLKELIKVRGFQVPPAELEDILLSHPQIRDAAVIGVPDRKAGELPRAYVVRSSDKLTEKDVFEFVKAKVSYYKQLKGGIVFINEVPKSASGKILRRRLRDEAIAEMKDISKI